MTLPYDYARCLTGEDCPLKNRCARWLSVGRTDGTQVCAVFPGGKDCEGFIEEKGNAPRTI